MAFAPLAVICLCERARCVDAPLSRQETRVCFCGGTKSHRHISASWWAAASCHPHQRAGINLHTRVKSVLPTCPSARQTELYSVPIQTQHMQVGVILGVLVLVVEVHFHISVTWQFFKCCMDRESPDLITKNTVLAASMKTSLRSKCISSELFCMLYWQWAEAKYSLINL